MLVCSLQLDLECGFPASVANGDYKLVNGTRAYLSGVEYSCKEGFVVVGRSYLSCDVDERWNGPPPRCEPILCPSPPALQNGLYAMSTNSTVFGSRAFYSCLPGHEMVGESSIVCNNAGYWDGQPPLCRGKTLRQARLHLPVLMRGASRVTLTLTRTSS